MYGAYISSDNVLAFMVRMINADYVRFLKIDELIPSFVAICDTQLAIKKAILSRSERRFMW